MKKDETKREYYLKEYIRLTKRVLDDEDLSKEDKLDIIGLIF